MSDVKPLTLADAVYQAAIRQHREQRKLNPLPHPMAYAVAPSVTGGFTPYGNPLSGLFATDEPAPARPRSESWADQFARPSASQPPPASR